MMKKQNLSDPAKIRIGGLNEIKETLNQRSGCAAVFRPNILHLCGFDSIKILFQRGEITQNTGSAP